MAYKSTEDILKNNGYAQAARNELQLQESWEDFDILEDNGYRAALNAQNAPREVYGPVQEKTTTPNTQREVYGPPLPESTATPKVSTDVSKIPAVRESVYGKYAQKKAEKGSSSPLLSELISDSDKGIPTLRDMYENETRRYINYITPEMAKEYADIVARTEKLNISQRSKDLIINKATRSLNRQAKDRMYGSDIDAYNAFEKEVYAMPFGEERAKALEELERLRKRKATADGYFLYDREIEIQKEIIAEEDKNIAYYQSELNKERGIDLKKGFTIPGKEKAEEVKTGNKFFDNMLSGEYLNTPEGKLTKAKMQNDYFERQIAPLIEMTEKAEADPQYKAEIAERYQSDPTFRAEYDKMWKAYEDYTKAYPQIEKNYKGAYEEYKKELNKSILSSEEGQLNLYTDKIKEEMEQARTKPDGTGLKIMEGKRIARELGIDVFDQVKNIKSVPIGPKGNWGDVIRKRAFEKVSQEEKDIYYYTLAKYGEEQATDYLNKLVNSKANEVQRKDNEILKATAIPGIRYLEGLALKPVASAEGIARAGQDVIEMIGDKDAAQPKEPTETVGKYLLFGENDPEKRKDVLSNYSAKDVENIIKSTKLNIPDRFGISEYVDILEEAMLENKGTFGRVATQLATTLGDMAVAVWMGNALAGGSLGLSTEAAAKTAKAASKFTRGVMAGEVFSDNYNQAIENGVSTDKALLGSLLGASATYALEKVPLDKMGAGKYSDKFLKRIFKAGLPEGIEEFAEAEIDNLIDKYYYADKGQWQKMVDEYMRQGYSEQEAQNKANIEGFIITPLKNFGMGALAGGLMGEINLQTLAYNAGANVLSDSDSIKSFDEFTNALISEDVSDYSGKAVQMQEQLKKYKSDFENSKTKLGKVMSAGKAMAVASEFNGVPKVTATHEISDEDRGFLNALSKADNINILYTEVEQELSDDGRGYRAGYFVPGTNTAVIDYRATAADIFEITAGHEVGHSIEGSKYYEAFKAKAIEDINAEGAKSGETFNSLVLAKGKKYADAGEKITKSAAEAEVIADYIGKVIKDNSLAERMAKRDYGTARLIVDKVKDLYGKVESYFNPDAKKGIDETVRLLERAVGMRNTKALTSAAGVQYNISKGNYEQYGMTWTIGAGALTKNEVSAFSDKISEMKNNKYVNYKMSNEGEYIFSVGNKLIYSDADYDNPSISKVITFNTDNENYIDCARETIYDYEKWGYDISNAIELAEVVLGEKFISSANYEDFHSDRELQNNERKRSNGGKIDIGSREDVSHSIENLSPEQVEKVKQAERLQEMANGKVNTMGQVEKENTPISRSLDRTAMRWVDRFTFLKRFDQAAEESRGGKAETTSQAYTMAMNSLNSDGTVMYMIKNHMTNLNGDVNIGKGLFEILEPIKSKQESKDFEMYLIAKHAEEWLANDRGGEVKTVYGDDNLDTPESARLMAENYERQYPNFKSMAEEIYEFQKAVLLNFGVEGGILSQAAADRFFGMYPNYVPFYRDMGEVNGDSIRREFADLDAGIERAAGSNEKIKSPLESIIANTAGFVNTAKKNAVMQAIYNQAVTTEGLEAFVEVIPPEEYASEEAERALRRDGSVARVLVNGEARYLMFNDTDLLSTVKGYNDEKKLGAVMSFFAGAGNVFKTLTTSGNAMFSLGSNIWRDIDTAYKSSDIVNPVKFAGKYIKSLFTQLKSNEDFQRYLAMGGRWETSVVQNRNAMKKLYGELNRKNDKVAKRILYYCTKGIYDGVQALSDAVETTPRFMEFVNTLNKTGDIQKAIYDSGEVTTNFKRRGTSSRELETLLPYTNARIQGTKKLVDLWKGKPVQTAAKMIGVATIMCLVKAGLRDLVDEEDYKDLSTYTKDNFHLFAIGNGKYISFPKSQNFAVFDTIADRTVERIKEKNPDAYKNLISYMLNNFLPVDFFGAIADGIEENGYKGIFTGSANGLVDTVSSMMIVGTIAQCVANRDFKGSKITPARYERLEPEEQYDENTTYLAKIIGKFTGLSPFKVDHVLSSNFGYLAKLNESFGREKKDYFLGLGNKFIKNSVYSNEILSGFYEAKNAANIKFATEQERGTVSEEAAFNNYFYNGANAVISNLYKLQDKAETPAEKEEIRRQINSFVKGLNNNFKNATYKEIARVYKETDNGEAFPFVPLDISVDEYGYSTKLNAAGYVEATKKYNENILKTYEEVMKTDTYKKMTDKEKASALSSIKEAVKSRSEYEAFSGNSDYLVKLSGSDQLYKAREGINTQKEILRTTVKFYPDDIDKKLQYGDYNSAGLYMDYLEKNNALTGDNAAGIKAYIEGKDNSKVPENVKKELLDIVKATGSYAVLERDYTGIFEWQNEWVKYKLEIRPEDAVKIMETVDGAVIASIGNMIKYGYRKEKGGIGEITVDGQTIPATWENMTPEIRASKISAYKTRANKIMRNTLGQKAGYKADKIN